MRVSLKESIRQTIAYASFFDFDLTVSELHYWLISPTTHSLSSVKKLSDRGEELVTKRKARLLISTQKLIRAEKFAHILSIVPTIKLIALTGSLAMNNAKKNDDIDLMIVTKQGTLWLTRLFVVPLIRLFFKSRYPVSHPRVFHSLTPFHPRGSHSATSGVVLNTTDSVCLNLWLDTSALNLPRDKRSLYTAHEVLQIKPLLNRNHTYERFILENSWTKPYLANAYELTTKNFPPRERLQRASHSRGGRMVSPGVNSLVSLLNLLAFRLQYLYMHSKMTSETVNLHSAYFHPRSLASDLDNQVQPHNL